MAHTINTSALTYCLQDLTSFSGRDCPDVAATRWPAPYMAGRHRYGIFVSCVFTNTKLSVDITPESTLSFVGNNRWENGVVSWVKKPFWPPKIPQTGNFYLDVDSGVMSTDGLGLVFPRSATWILRAILGMST